MAAKTKSSVTAKDLIAKAAQPMARRCWAPPPELLPELDTLIRNNANHAMPRVNRPAIVAWLKDEHGVRTTLETLRRWMNLRAIALGLVK